MRNLSHIIALATVGFATSLSPASAEIYGLVIGIDEYDHIPSLDGAVNDALDISDALEALGATVVSLYDREATRKRIFQEWTSLAAKIGPDDLLIISYAGHGSNEPEFWSGNERDGRDETLLLSGFSTSGETSGHRIRDDEIASLLALAPADQTVFVADACYAGTLSRSVRPTLGYRYFSYGKLVDDPLPPPPPNTARDEGRNALGLFLAAVDESSKVPEFLIDGQARGALSYAFASSLRGKADRDGDGALTLGEIESHVRRTIRSISRGLQIPQIARSRSSDTVLMSLGTPEDKGLPPRPSERGPSKNPWQAAFDSLPPYQVAVGEGELARELVKLDGVNPSSHPSMADFVLNPKTGRITSNVGDVIATLELDSSLISSAELQRMVDKARLTEFLMSEVQDNTLNITFADGDQLYRNDQIIEIKVSGRSSSYLTLFNIAADGKIAYLYPIQDAAAGIDDPLSLSPQSAFALPLRITPPFGADHVIALESDTDPVTIRKLLMEFDGSTDVRQLWSELRLGISTGSPPRLAVFPFFTAE